MASRRRLAWMVLPLLLVACAGPSDPGPDLAPPPSPVPSAAADAVAEPGAAVLSFLGGDGAVGSNAAPAAPQGVPGVLGAAACPATHPVKQALVPETADEAVLQATLTLCLDRDVSATPDQPVDGVVLNSGDVVWVVSGPPGLAWNNPYADVDPQVRTFRRLLAERAFDGLALEPRRSAQIALPRLDAFSARLDLGAQATWSSVTALSWLAAGKEGLDATSWEPDSRTLAAILDCSDVVFGLAGSLDPGDPRIDPQQGLDLAGLGELMVSSGTCAGSIAELPDPATGRAALTVDDLLPGGRLTAATRPVALGAVDDGLRAGSGAWLRHAGRFLSLVAPG